LANARYEPIRHNHKAFLRKAKKRSGFQRAYQSLAVEYNLAGKLLARARAGLTPSKESRRI